MIDNSQASAWRSLLEELHDDIQSLDTTGYRRSEAASDRWTQCRSHEPEAHLEVDVRLLGIQSMDRSHQVHRAEAIYSYRRVSEDDSSSQAAAYASMQDLWRLLLCWHSGDVRSIPRSSSVRIRADDYLISITFDLLVPWRP